MKSSKVPIALSWGQLSTISPSALLSSTTCWRAHQPSGPQALRPSGPAAVCRKAPSYQNTLQSTILSTCFTNIGLVTDRDKEQKFLRHFRRRKNALFIIFGVNIQPNVKMGKHSAKRCSVGLCSWRPQPCLRASCSRAGASFQP